MKFPNVKRYLSGILATMLVLSSCGPTTTVYADEEDWPSLEEVIDFHVCFERIHPFQDGNGRVGRLIMFKECLANDVVPFIIADDMKAFYYRGLAEWGNEPGYLTDTCLAAQDRFKAMLDYFRIPPVG